MMPTLISITVMVMISIIIILLLIGGFLYVYMRSHRRKFKSDAIVPCVQTVERTLVIKIDDPIANKEEMREKETSLCAESNHSSVQVQLDQKLPDTISSRSTETS